MVYLLYGVGYVIKMQNAVTGCFYNYKYKPNGLKVRAKAVFFIEFVNNFHYFVCRIYQFY